MPKHDKIGSQTIERIGERGWLILLEEKVAYPSKAVSGNGHKHKEFPVVGYYSGNAQRNYQRSSSKMKPSTNGICVFGKVERIEFFERCEAFCGSH